VDTPIRNEPEVVVSPDPQPPVRPARQPVLVVDDNHDAADSLAQVLALCGVDVRVAYNGPDALRVFDEEPIALAFLDLGMPGMHGSEVARRVRATGSVHRVTLIALSGYGQPEDIEEARQAGFDHHVLKPADFDDLQAVLRRFLPGPD
jgi:two-component system, sensor histidine kinase